jgi:hypothetical protein
MSEEFVISYENKLFMDMMRRLVKAIRNREENPTAVEELKQEFQGVHVTLAYNGEADKVRLITLNHTLDFKCSDFE